MAPALVRISFLTAMVAVAAGALSPFACGPQRRSSTVTAFDLGPPTESPWTRLAATPSRPHGPVFHRHLGPFARRHYQAVGVHVGGGVGGVAAGSADGISYVGRKTAQRWRARTFRNAWMVVQWMLSSAWVFRNAAIWR